MQIYQDNALNLARAASQEALADAPVLPEEITHLVTVTCTGFASPGVDVGLIEQLQLPATTQRIRVGFMGCHGAINGLRTIRGLTAADPDAKVLLCCIELCSPHFRVASEADIVIGSALFGDGAAALVAEAALLTLPGN